MQSSSFVRSFAKKTNKSQTALDAFGGGFIRVRETYAREDVHAPSVITNAEDDELIIVPTASALDTHFETLRACGLAASKAIILGSVVNRLRAQGFGRTLQKLRQCVLMDASRTWVGFADENCNEVPEPRNTTNALIYLGSWTMCTVVVLSENTDFRDQLSSKCPSLLIMSTIDFVREFCNPTRGILSKVQFDHLLAVADSAQAALIRSNNNLSSLKIVSEATHQATGPRKRGKLKCVGPRIAFVGDDTIIISSELRNHAIHGDIVEVCPTSISASEMKSSSESDEESVHRGKYTPSVVMSIVQRDESRRNLVVTLDVKESESLSNENESPSLKKLLCVPMDDRYPKLRVASRLGGALLGKRFVVSITDWPADSQWPDARYIRTLGNALDLSVESSAILVECELEDHERPFPQNAMDELPLKENVNFEGAEDMRDRRVMSIDPIGCQDIDDAMSLERRSDGTFELGVHIADVSRFVKSGSTLDREALSRATSVYLQERRLDMLPALLCEDLCSLRPQCDRFAVTAIFKVDSSFNVDLPSVRFVRTIIRSRYALAYEQAQRISEDVDPGEFKSGKGWTGGKVNSNDLEWMKETIGNLMNIARKRESMRNHRGAVSLESEGEYKFALNAEMKPTQVQSSHHMEIHDTVAELMILANEAAARVTFAKFPTRALLRHHPPADENRFRPCIELAKSLGVDFDASSNKNVSASLQRVRDKCSQAEVKLIESLATRAMSEAQYICAGTSRNEMGGESPFYHFGLGLDFYTHFTSPIRRYADVIVARLLLEDPVAKEEPPTRAEVVPNAEESIRKEDEALSQKDKGEKKKPNIFQEEETEDDLSWANALGGGDDDEDDDFLTSKQVPKSWASKPQDLKNTLEDNLSPVNTLGPAKEVATKTPEAPPGDFSDLMSWIGSLNDAKTDSQNAVKPNSISETSESLGVHTTTRGVQSACDHINKRHRSAKEASSKSQSLFFSLYFSEFPQTVMSVVIDIRSSGLVCFCPAFDLRIPIFLDEESTHVRDETGQRRRVAHVDVQGGAIQLLLENGRDMKLSSMSRINVHITCEKNDNVAPRPPRLVGELDLSEDMSVQNKSSMKQTVMKQQQQHVNNKTSVVQRDSFYLSFCRAKLRPSPSSAHLKRATNPSATTRRMCFGGFVSKNKSSLATSLLPFGDDDDEEDEVYDLRPAPSMSASRMTTAQMKRLEIQATSRLAKLQAEKYDSRVKRRMKKD